MSKMDERAPAGMVYFCPLCGKTSPTQSGWEKLGNGREHFVGERGWDVSCSIHSYLVEEHVVKLSRIQEHGN